METLSGTVERITYYNPENGYSVVRLRLEQSKTRPLAPPARLKGLVTITGNLPELTPGEFVRLEGQFVNHPKHGMQFQAEICEQAVPATLEGIRRYLGSGLIKGIGPKMAGSIVDHFGLQTLEIIENHPNRLREVPDIGPKRSRLIAAAWHEQKQIRDVMLFLQSHGISTNLSIKIYKTYGESALDSVQSNPYQLARDIFGIGFKTADRIAQSLGLETDHPSRIEAGIIFVLNQMIGDGHVFAPKDELEKKVSHLLEVQSDLVSMAIVRMMQNDFLQTPIVPVTLGKTAKLSLELGNMDDPSVHQVVYLSPYYYGEIGVARRLANLAKAIPSRLSDIPPFFVILDPTLTIDQQDAIRTALTHPVSILTGGPGTGKTTTLKALIAVVEGQKKRYALCAPTGRAAKRLSEAVGRPASTIHRLLGYTMPSGFSHNNENPLQIDLLVIDEASMLDLLLANNLLKALEPGTHVLLVGDVDQLPSVGAGDVLRDVIASDQAPVRHLRTIFRQEAGSLIITNAHRINEGQTPVFPKSPTGSDKIPDFYLFPAEGAESAGNWVIEVVVERIPQRFGFDPMIDIQVIAPMYRGPAGVRSLNERLQSQLNPPDLLKPEKTLFGQTFRKGDKVMQLQNDYDKEVFNGDIGTVLDIHATDHTMSVNFEGRRIFYDWSEADQLTLAYCVSVHKSQGAEFRAVVMPIVTHHYMMLQRNLLYTAITRAKKLCVLVGSQRAIGMAVRNNKVVERYSALAWRLGNE